MEYGIAQDEQIRPIYVTWSYLLAAIAFQYDASSVRIPLRYYFSILITFSCIKLVAIIICNSLVQLLALSRSVSSALSLQSSCHFVTYSNVKLSGISRNYKYLHSVYTALRVPRWYRELRKTIRTLFCL